MIDNPYAVLAAVFLVMAALGIPLIWMCRAWSPPVKVLLTIITLIYTALLIGLCWLAVSWAIHVWQSASGAEVSGSTSIVFTRTLRSPTMLL